MNPFLGYLLLGPLRKTAWWPTVRPLVLLAIYAGILTISWWLAYQLRFDFEVPVQHRVQLAQHWLFVVVVQLVFLGVFRQFFSVTRYFSLQDLCRLTLPLLTSGLLLYLIRFVHLVPLSPPRGVILIQFLIALTMVSACRISYRLLQERYSSGGSDRSRKKENVAIVGAGDVGSNLVVEMDRRPGAGLRPVVFFDDDRHKWNSYLHNVPVVGPPESLPKWKEKYRISKVVIAMPSASPKRLAAIATLAQENGLSCVTVPAIDQLTSGQVSVNQLRPVSIEDLLGREPVSLESEAIRGTFHDRVVMVTGAGGSIGSELCRQIAAYGPRRLLVLDQSEVQLFQIEQEMIQHGHGALIVPLVANILDQARMKHLFGLHRPTVVFHAAAHKHVPMMEHQPTAAVMNNSIASARLAELALDFGVERFLMISTDKAVNPTSAMGASKRLAEIYLQALSAEHPQGTKFICVRFGNVLGSSGSVVPTFTRQIAAGGPVTVTHRDMVRYFMTIPEAAGLVLQGCAQGQGGEIFVLDMGVPVKIADLARQMIELSGLKPDVDIEIKYVGLRPGEKLFEELKCHGEDHRATRHPRIMSFICQTETLAELRSAFARLEADLYSLEPAALRHRLCQLVPEYNSTDGASTAKTASLRATERADGSPLPVRSAAIPQ
jgi:FlaA1/EpsC-like NDP-sugar epimerase